MPRNLNRRVEVLTQVHDDRLKKYLKDVVLDTYLRRQRQSAPAAPRWKLRKNPVGRE